MSLYITACAFEVGSGERGAAFSMCVSEADPVSEIVAYALMLITGGKERFAVEAGRTLLFSVTLISDEGQAGRRGVSWQSVKAIEAMDAAAMAGAWKQMLALLIPIAFDPAAKRSPEIEAAAAALPRVH